MKGDSLKHIFKKENVLFISVITILILIIYVLLTIFIFYVNCYFSMIRYNSLSRTLVVKKADKSEKDLDNISNINHVVINVGSKYYYYNNFYTPILEEDSNLSIGIGAIINENDLKIVKGRNPENLNEIVIPVNFCPYKEFYIQKDKFINGNKLIGTTITVKSDKLVNYNLDYDDPKFFEIMNNKKTVTLTIVGTYDSTINLAQANNAFATMETIDNLRSSAGYVDRMIIVDSYKNLNYVKNELIKQGFDFFEAWAIDLTEFSIAILVSLGVPIILLIVAFVLIKKFIKKKLNNRHTTLLKAIGYTDKDIKKIEFTENIMIILFCTLIAFIIYFIIYLVVTKNFLTLFDYYSYTVKIPIFLITILLIFMIIFIKVITNRITKNVLKQDVMQLIKEE